MAINIGPLLTRLSSSLPAAASSSGTSAALSLESQIQAAALETARSSMMAMSYRQPAASSQAPLPKPTFLGGMGDLAAAGFSIPTAVATFPARLASREVATGVRMATGIGANVAGGVEGEVFSSTVGEATAGLQSFVNVLTVPNVSNFATFMEQVTTAPGKVEKFAEALLKSRDELAQYSPEYARARAEREIGDIRRKFESAQRTGASALELTRGLEEIKDALQPLRDALFDETADLLKRMVPFVEDIAEELLPLIPALGELASVAVELFKIMLSAVPWDLIKGTINTINAILDLLGDFKNSSQTDMGRIALAIGGFATTGTAIGAVIPALFDWLERNKDSDKQRELREMAEAKSVHSQEMVRSILFGDRKGPADVEMDLFGL